MLAAGRAACEELEYDYGDGSFWGGRAAVARVQEMLGVDEPTSWMVVESASDFICQWSHLADAPLPFPPRSSFRDCLTHWLFARLSSPVEAGMLALRSSG